MLIRRIPSSASHFYVGSLKFTTRHRVSYQEDTYDIRRVDVPKYGRWEYQGGLEMDWQINQQIDLTAGYDHYNLWAKQDFDEQDRSIDTIYIRPASRLHPR